MLKVSRQSSWQHLISTETEVVIKININSVNVALFSWLDPAVVIGVLLGGLRTLGIEDAAFSRRLHVCHHPPLFTPQELKWSQERLRVHRGNQQPPSLKQVWSVRILLTNKPFECASFVHTTEATENLPPIIVLFYSVHKFYLCVESC